MTAAAQESQQATECEFTITRIIDAPRALVWKAFTEPERMKEWWGPKGSTIVASKMDLRVGGTYHGAMRDPAGQVIWAKFTIVKSSRLTGSSGCILSRTKPVASRGTRWVQRGRSNS